LQYDDISAVRQLWGRLPSRLENRITKEDITNVSKLFVELFIESHDVPPKQIIIDVDTTDDTIYGDQEGKYFSGFYDDYCFLPLYFFVAVNCSGHNCVRARPVVLMVRSRSSIILQHASRKCGLMLQKLHADKHRGTCEGMRPRGCRDLLAIAGHAGGKLTDTKNVMLLTCGSIEFQQFLRRVFYVEALLSSD
jgi:hypothetical protein